MFTAAQAAQKTTALTLLRQVRFTAAQAAQKCCYTNLQDTYNVHCRTGSSEKKVEPGLILNRVHCRTGSSEIQSHGYLVKTRVHCRTGSSEKQPQQERRYLPCSLPHRQLRNGLVTLLIQTDSSLPHRQLRKHSVKRVTTNCRSLPHRQLRKE